MDWLLQIKEEHLRLAVELQLLSEILSGHNDDRDFAHGLVAFASDCRRHMKREQALFRSAGLAVLHELESLHFDISRQIGLVLSAHFDGADTRSTLAGLMDALSAAIRMETKLVAALSADSTARLQQPY